MKDLIVNDIHAQLLTASKIAKKHGVSRQYVQQIAKLIGVTPYKRPQKPQRDKKMVDDGLIDQRRKYKQHKLSAAKRGIEFNLTFDEWWGLWEPHYHLRGVGKGKMCMCRTLDQGPYEINNVRIDRVENNGHEKKASNHNKRGTKWMRQPTSEKGCGQGLPNFAMCQQEDLEEDPFVYYAELVTSCAHTERD